MYRAEVIKLLDCECLCMEEKKEEEEIITTKLACVDFIAVMKRAFGLIMGKDWMDIWAPKNIPFTKKDVATLFEDFKAEYQVQCLPIEIVLDEYGYLFFFTYEGHYECVWMTQSQQYFVIPVEVKDEAIFKGSVYVGYQTSRGFIVKDTLAFAGKSVWDEILLVRLQYVQAFLINDKKEEETKTVKIDFCSVMSFYDFTFHFLENYQYNCHVLLIPVATGYTELRFPSSEINPFYEVRLVVGFTGRIEKMNHDLITLENITENVRNETKEKCEIGDKIDVCRNNNGKWIYLRHNNPNSLVIHTQENVEERKQWIDQAMFSSYLMELKNMDKKD